MNDNPRTNTAILSLEGLSFHYPERAAIIDKLDFTLNEKTHIGIAAPNGSGKSTLFHLIVGLLKPYHIQGSGDQQGGRFQTTAAAGGPAVSECR